MHATACLAARNKCLAAKNKQNYPASPHTRLIETTANVRVSIVRDLAGAIDAEPAECGN